MAVSQKHNKPVLPRTTDGSDLGSNRASIYSGKGLSFDGVNDQIQGATGTPLPNSNYTICSWFYMDTLKTQGIVTWGDDTTGERRGMIIWNGSPPGYYCLRSSTYGSNPYGATELKVNTWYFGAVTVDSSGNASIYLNGELDGTGTNTLNAFSNTGYVVGNTRTNEWMDGKISAPRVFNVVLTATQIKELYNNPEQAVPTGVDATSLVLHLPMTEGAGSYLYNANANAIGTELISNAGFDETCQKWGTTDSSTVEISGGKAIWTNAPLAGSFVEQPLDLEVGKFYRVKFDYTSTAFNIFVNVGNTQQAVPLGNGTFVYDMYYGAGTSSLKFKHGYSSGSSATVDNVSVKEVVPNVYNGTINGATWVQGLPEPLPQTALMDWNKYPFLDGTGDRYHSPSSMKNFNSISGGGVSSYCRIIMGDKINNNQNFFSWGDNDGFRVRISDNNYFTVIQDGGANVLVSTTSFVSGQLYTVVAVVDSAGSRLYLDGLLIASNSTAFAKPHSVYNLTIGGYNSTTELLDGSVIDLKLWEYGLSDADASALSGNQITPESLTEYEIAHFDGANDYDDKLGNYSGIFSTKEYEFQYLVPSGSTAGKDVFGNTISKPRASGAYNFDGASYVQGLNKGYLPTGNEARSLEIWVYHRPVPGATASQSLMEIGSGTGTNERFGIMVTSPAYALYVVGQGNDNAFSSFSIPENEWTHIVLTHNGTTLKVYKNGSLNGSVNETYATIDVGYRIGLENRTTSTTSISGSYEWTRSQIANPRIYNYALTAEQVADNFNEKASTFGGTKVASELDAYIERTASDGATVEAHSCLVNYLTELDKK